MKLTVLIIDDDPIFTAFLCTLLKNDFECCTANEGHAAITVAMNSVPAIILLDIVMPGMTGHEVATALSYLPETKNTPIIFITGEPLDVTRSMPANVVACIQKTLKAEEIRQKLLDNVPPAPESK